MASIAEIQAIVERIYNDLPLLIERSKITPKQVVTVTGLSDISERLGLVQAGEFRTGNGKEPGFGFTGVRIGYPAFVYDGDLWHIAGVNDDVLQIGINATDGKLYFGEGVGILSSSGIRLIASGLFSDNVAYGFEDSDGEHAGGLYATVDGSDNTYIALRAHGQNGGPSQTASVDAVASNTASARLSADSGLNAGAAAELVLEQTATGTLYVQNVDLVDFTGAYVEAEDVDVTGGYYVDGEQILVSDTAVLSSSYSISASGTWEDTGLSVTLPSAGRYALDASVRVGLLNNTAGAFMLLKFYNSTDSADVTNSEAMGAYQGVANQTYVNQLSMTGEITVTASKVIKLYAFRTSTGAYTFSSIDSDTNGRTRMRYIKLE
jgi:hypothetical protein